MRFVGDNWRCRRQQLCGVERSGLGLIRVRAGGWHQSRGAPIGPLHNDYPPAPNQQTTHASSRLMIDRLVCDRPVGPTVFRIGRGPESWHLAFGVFYSIHDVALADTAD